ncbi:hypothetical protein ZEAMMB73_Zm00001d049177 [Zea mays]|uniref:Uncharacterized protein n=1 Tax=Zea mays TaxID=4577 RepID=A0A1D6PSX5_MAIZE|nr:hypothetical protein ZEAMMB73_Zm00001d049177 [Zea mays]
MKGYQVPATDYCCSREARPPPVQARASLGASAMSTEEELLVAPCTQMTVLVMRVWWPLVARVGLPVLVVVGRLHSLVCICESICSQQTCLLLQHDDGPAPAKSSIGCCSISYISSFFQMYHKSVRILFFGRVC